jgi:hypothetical protein
MIAACNNGAGGTSLRAVVRPIPSFNALRIIKKILPMKRATTVSIYLTPFLNPALWLGMLLPQNGNKLLI